MFVETCRSANIASENLVVSNKNEYVTSGSQVKDSTNENHIMIAIESKLNEQL